jgi:hypothetical protein
MTAREDVMSFARFPWSFRASRLTNPTTLPAHKRESCTGLSPKRLARKALMNGA